MIILCATGRILFNGSSLCLCGRGTVAEKQLQYCLVYNIVKKKKKQDREGGGQSRVITLSTLLRISYPSLIR